MAAIQLFSPTDPRGTFTFTGAASGSDLADFLLGIPDTSSLAFGNADEYFANLFTTRSDRDPLVYVTDDWLVLVSHIYGPKSHLHFHELR